MRSLFADTVYFAALLDRSDQWHQAAIEAHRRAGQARLVTTQEVLTEVLNLLSSYRHLRQAAVAYVRRLQQSANVEIVPSSPESFAAGLALYDARPDKERSLTDCVSIALMEERGLTEALTHNQHFIQAGISTLF